MNRTENLSEALRSWVDSHRTITEVVVVDWSSEVPICENSTVKDLLEGEKIKVVRVNGEKYFSLPMSYNLAIKYTSESNKIILKLDADYVLKDARWLDCVYNQVVGIEGISSDDKLFGYFITGNHLFSLSYTGFALFNKENFVQYNENIEGYGADDMEMYERMKNDFPNLKEILFFNIKNYIYHIPHSDEERGANYRNKNIRETTLKNMQVSGKFRVATYKEISKNNNLTIVERITS